MRIKRTGWKKVFKQSCNYYRIFNKHLLTVCAVSLLAVGFWVLPAMADEVESAKPVADLAKQSPKQLGGMDFAWQQAAEVEKTKKQPAKTAVASSKAARCLGTFKVTAYCNCKKCQGKWVGQTATGKPLKIGRTIAVDRKTIPLGSEVLLEGLGWRVAEDTGGAIKGNHIDLYVASHQEALKWGKKSLQVWIR